METASELFKKSIGQQDTFTAVELSEIIESGTFPDFDDRLLDFID
jgi:hypothetical protein